MAGEVHGSNAVFKVQNAGGVLTVVDGGSSASLEESIDTAEVTAFADGSKRYIPGLDDATASLDGSYTPTNVALLRGVKKMVRTFEYYPAGTASGNEKLAGSLIVTSISRSSDIGDKVGVSAAFQITGGVTGTTIP